jgi:hypothetical protein
MPSRAYADKPALTKRKAAAELKHLSAPLKGLSLSTKLTEGDPLSAPILDNFNVEDDRISCRAGTRLFYTRPGGLPIWALIPYYGGLNRLAGAAGGAIFTIDGVTIKTGFGGNDWHWTSFSNLSANEYTVLVNGIDGVWSWDGSLVSTPVVSVTVTSLSKSTAGTNAVCTVAAGDIAKFSNGQVVMISGGVGPGMENANGQRIVVDISGNTFGLYGVDTSAASAAQTTGVKAEVPGTGLFKETVTAPSWAPHINPNQFQIVVSHMNRLWFADNSNLSIYYLPIQQKSGEVTELPLNSIFKRGGSIRAMYQWTTDGGSGLDDMLCIFSTNGEVVIYRGVDPDSDFTLVGIFRFDSPMTKHSAVNFGGDLYVLISTGLVPMSGMLKMENEQLGVTDQQIFSLFFRSSQIARSSPGWGVMLNPSSGRMICNIPQGAPNLYRQAVKHMMVNNGVWSTWSAIQSRCWAWIDNRVFVGSDTGQIYEVNPAFLNDNGAAITVDVQPAWHSYGSSSIKQFKMLLAYIITDGVPKHRLDFRVDYDTRPPGNVPDVTEASTGAKWAITQEDPVDGAEWAGSVRRWQNWQGIAAIGRVGAPRLTADIRNCSFAITGFDVLYEQGGIFG